MILYFLKLPSTPTPIQDTYSGDLKLSHAGPLRMFDSECVIDILCAVSFFLKDGMRAVPLLWHLARSSKRRLYRYSVHLRSYTNLYPSFMQIKSIKSGSKLGDPAEMGRVLIVSV